MTMHRIRVLVVMAVLAIQVGSWSFGLPSRAAATPFTLSSSDFPDGGRLPASIELSSMPGLTCNGANLLPTLTWSGVPPGTRSFALTILDPDAAAFVTSGFVHWVVYNVPGSVRRLDAHTAGLYTQGTTGFGTTGFHGPCPPTDGQTHHYVFTLFALKIGHLAGKALTRDALLTAMAGHVLGGTSLIGTFSRT
jgi:Raf kinase inhibitor-like YbhB/YbcL family protein